MGLWIYCYQKISAAIRRMWVLYVLVSLTSVFLVCAPEVALAKKKQESSSGVVRLVVIKPSATVYSKADFDSDVLIVLPARRQVYGTAKTITGAAGLGLFHKIRLKKGLYGFVLDTDVRSTGAAAPAVKKKNDTSVKEERSTSPRSDKSAARRDKGRAQTKSGSQSRRTLKDSAATARSKKNARTLEPEEMPTGFDITQPQNMGPKHVGPFFFRKYLGVNLGMLNYSEKITDATKSSSEWFAGLKLTGTDWLFSNFLLDINLNVHVGAPIFFEDFSNDATGFIAQLDVTMPFMLRPLKNGAIYGGIGPLVSATSYKFNYLGEDRKSQNVRLGAAITLGVGYEFGGFAFRLEPKYYWENSRYFGVLAGIQKRL